MSTRRSSSQETITLSWLMNKTAWNHWVQGLGKKPVVVVVLEGLDQIRKSSEAAKKIRDRCKSLAQDTLPEVQFCGRQDDKSSEHKIEIQLPAGDWGDACQRVGYIDCEPVRTDRLLAALILESESWKQSGNAEAEHDAGWNEDALVFSFMSLSPTTDGLSLGRRERIIAWILAAAAVVGALAGVASAIAAWCSP